MSMRKTVLLMIILLFLAVGFGYFKYRFAGQPLSLGTVATTPSPSPVAEVPRISPTDQLIQKLTSQQKIAQLIAYPVTLAASSSATLESTPSATLLSPVAQTFLAKNTPGFVTLYGDRISTAAAQKTVKEVKSLTADSLTTDDVLSPLQPIFAVDHEGGTVQRLSGKGFTKLPSWQSWCNSTAADKNASVLASAKELNQAGIQMIFGPVVDVATSSSFLKARLCSEDPEVVVEQAEKWGSIFARQGVIPIIKHYPGIGTATKDLHLGFIPISPSLEEQHIFGQILLDSPDWGVMVSHSGFNKPCSLDSECIYPLRKAFPDALLFTDGLEMKALQQEHKNDLGILSVQAIQAGNDVLVFGGGISADEFDEVLNRLVHEYESNPVFKSKVDEHLQRVLEHKQHV